MHFLSVLCYYSVMLATVLKTVSLVIFLSLTIYACKSKQPVDRLFYLPGDYRSLNDSSYAELKKKFRHGYTEEFNLDGASFRYNKTEQGSDSFVLQVKKKGNWTDNIFLPLPKYQFYLHNDVDRDGHVDLTQVIGETDYTYFFQSADSGFDPEPVVYPADHALLDEKRLIYGANRKTADWNVEIFELRNRKKWFLYKALLTRDEHLIVKESFVYACRNGNENDTVFLRKEVINKGYGDFMLNRYMHELID
jgi:hypothetical protein